MSKLLKLYEWCDSLWESGRYGEVGTGMVNTLKGKIGESYKEGRKAAEREAVRSQRSVRRKRVP